MTASAPGLVLADEFGTNNPPDGGGPLADSLIHTFCWGAGFDANLQDNASWAMLNSLNIPTQMIDSFEACTGSTDVKFLDADLPSPTRGQYSCIAFAAPGTCNSGQITVDPAQLNIGINDEEDTTKTMCHEIGHSVGMMHAVGTNDCMRNGEVPDQQLLWRKYTGHHVQHVNDAY